MTIPWSESGVDSCSLIESSSADQESVGAAFDDFGNGRFPGFSTSGPDGYGEAYNENNGMG